jgi:hypothetical protein
VAGEQQRGTAAGQNQFGQPGTPREQAGQRLAPQDPGIRTRQNIVSPGNRFGQQRGFNFQSGAPDPRPTAAERQAQDFGAETQTRGTRAGIDTTANGPQDQVGAAAGMRNGQFGTTVEGQPGELGVWLAAGGGPGVEIRRITESSAAAEVGLQPGDVLLEVNGRPVSSPTEVRQLIRSIPAGQAVTLQVLRDGASQELSVTLQRARQNYQSGYRGDEMMMSGGSGDLESRTMRLEEQVTMVMRELEQIRAEMGRLNSEPASTSAGGAIGVETPPSPFDRIETSQPEAAAVEEPAATEPDAFGTEAEATATEAEPAAAPTEPAPADDSGTEADTDLFGGAAEQSDAAETPAEETKKETNETESDSLFE